MKLLIVDDEINILKFVSESLDMHSIQVDELFTATSVAEAKKIMQQKKIDILLSDIEMPQENGLQLIEWANQHHYPSTNIIITCHNDFEFAQKGISLGIFSYILKPFSVEELSDVLTQAVNCQREKMIVNIPPEHMHHRSSGPKPGSDVEWMKIISGQETYSPYIPNVTYSLVLIAFQQWKETTGLHVHSDISFLMNSITTDYVLLEYESNLVLICPEKSFSRPQLISFCNNVLQNLLNNTTASLIYHIPVTLDSLHSVLLSCIEMTKTGMLIHSTVVDHGLYVSNQKEEPDRLPNMNSFRIHMINGNIPGIIAAVNNWEAQISSNNVINKKTIVAFCYAMEELFYQIAAQYSLDATVIIRKMSVDIVQKSYDSISDFHIYIATMCNLLYREISESQTTTPLVHKVISYIQDNYCYDISMNDIAVEIGMNKDHLSKVFQQNKGVTPIDYLNNYRLEQAKKMLLKGGLSISDVPSLCGFNSSSYFCRVFKQSTGLSPKDYRKKPS